MGITYLAATKSASDGTKNILTGNQNYFIESFDSWTLCVSALSFSGYDESRSALWNSALAPQLIGVKNQTPCEILLEYSTNENFSENYKLYSRYWHGSGSLFILISSEVGFENFKSFYYLLILFGIIFFASMWSSTELKNVPIFFLIPLLLGTNHFLFESNFVHILPLTSALIFGGVLGRISEDKKLLIIFISAMWANFLDLLTSPVLFFSVLAFAYLIPKLKRGSLAVFRSFAISVTIWFSAFFGTWVSKWFIAEFFGQSGEIRLAIEQGFFRATGAAFNDTNPSKFYPVLLNVESYLKQPLNSWTSMASIFGILILLIAIGCTKNFNLLKPAATFIACNIFLIVVWFVLFRNHSLIHSWFTFRSVALIPSETLALSFWILNQLILARKKVVLH